MKRPDLCFREGRPLSWAPSADAVAGKGRPLSYSLGFPSAHAVAGGQERGDFLTPSVVDVLAEDVLI